MKVKTFSVVFSDNSSGHEKRCQAMFEKLDSEVNAFIEQENRAGRRAVIEYVQSSANFFTRLTAIVKSTR